MASFVKAAALVAALALVPTTAARADGGGGGGFGAGPSSGLSTPRNDPASAYQDGVAALNRGDYRSAIRQLRIARRSLPNEPNVNYALGLAYSGNGDKNDARSAFERAVSANDAPAGAHLQLGLVYLELGQREDAMAQLNTLAELIAACDETCGAERRAQLQTAHDQLAGALAAPAAPAADPATTGWNFPGIEEGRRAYAEAVGLINQERFADALDALARAQAAAGPHPDVLNYMGFASRKLGRFDAALSYYRDALRIAPNHLGATEYLGELYIQMGDMARARTQLARLDALCAYGCAQREELALWIDRASE